MGELQWCRIDGRAIFQVRAHVIEIALPASLQTDKPDSYHWYTTQFYNNLTYKTSCFYFHP